MLLESEQQHKLVLNRAFIAKGMLTSNVISTQPGKGSSRSMLHDSHTIKAFDCFQGSYMAQ